MPRYASVMVDDSGGHRFDYEVPEQAAVQLGSRVRVPVRTRAVLGTVVGLSDHTEATGVKAIHQVVSAEPVLSPLLLQLAEWMAEYYCCTLEAALRCVLPQAIRKAEGGPKRQLFARLAAPVSPEELEALRKRAPLQAGVLDFLAAAPEPVAVAQLAKECDANHAVVNALQKKGPRAGGVSDCGARPF